MSAPIILVVEDGVETQVALKRDFTAFGCEVVIAGSAEEALDKLGGGLIPQIIVLDFLLPGMSGPEFYRQLRDRQDSNVPPIVPFTSTLDDSSSGSHGALTEFISAREGDQAHQFHPIVSKGGEEVIRTPLSLILAVVHCLQKTKIPLPVALKNELRRTLDTVIEGIE